MREQDKTPEKKLNEVEIGKLLEKEFRIMIVKMIQDLRKRMEAKIEKMQEMFNKDLEELKNKQKPYSRKDRKDEKAEGYVPDEGTRKNPRKKTK